MVLRSLGGTLNNQTTNGCELNSLEEGVTINSEKELSKVQGPHS
jgi:hypothetical protein